MADRPAAAPSGPPTPPTPPSPVTGLWPSPISAASLVEGVATVTDVVADGDTVWWSEARPSEGGRTAIVRWRDGEVADVTPPDTDVRTLVHEYGGGAWWVDGGELFHVEHDDQRLRRLTPDGATSVLTPEPAVPRGLRYADGRLTPDRRWFVCVREDHGDGTGEPVNEVVAVATDGSKRVEVLVSGPDFVASPRLSPDGRRLAWIAWNHPDMPWDDTELWTAVFADGALTDARRVAGDGEALAAPIFAPDGTLHVVSDRDEWWGLYRVDDQGGLEAVAVEDGTEIAEPHWQFGGARVTFVDGEPVWVRGRREGDSLSAGSTPGASHVGCLRSWRSGTVRLESSHGARPAIVTEDGGRRQVIHQEQLDLDPAFLPEPEAITYPTSDGDVAHALFYAPAHPERRWPAGHRPPLIVLAHGGPTAAARNELQLPLRYWTSRGFAVVDVDYRGSTGYGRTYRHALDGAWGVADVADCAAAARHLVGRGDVDPDRLGIRGGSAGGFTVLCALTFHDLFTAGCSRYGIADLEALATDTHKFESRYLDRLVGPWPEARSVYVERSPIHHVEDLTTPMLVLQGLDDPVVPPNQAEMIVAALEAKGVPVRYLAFEHESHGFRQAATIITALEAELDFFATTWGLGPAPNPDSPVPPR